MCHHGLGLQKILFTTRIYRRVGATPIKNLKIPEACTNIFRKYVIVIITTAVLTYDFLGGKVGAGMGGQGVLGTFAEGVVVGIPNEKHTIQISFGPIGHCESDPRVNRGRKAKAVQLPSKPQQTEQPECPPSPSHPPDLPEVPHRLSKRTCQQVRARALAML